MSKKYLEYVFFDYHCVVYYELFQPGQTVNKEYTEALCVICVNLFAKSGQNCGKITLGCCTTIICTHFQIALILRRFFIKIAINIVPQTPYLPDLAPCDFCLFAKLKIPSRGHGFESIREEKPNLRSCWRQFWKMTIWTASKTVKNIGISCSASNGSYFKHDELHMEE